MPTRREGRVRMNDQGQVVGIDWQEVPYDIGSSLIALQTPMTINGERRRMLTMEPALWNRPHDQVRQRLLEGLSTGEGEAMPQPTTYPIGYPQIHGNGTRIRLRRGEPSLDIPNDLRGRGLTAHEIGRAIEARARLTQSGPSPSPQLTNERITQALRADRFYYKFLCSALLTDFLTGSRMTRHRRFADALSGSESIETWRRKVLAGDQRELRDAIARFRDFFTDGDGTDNVWGPVAEVIRDLVQFTRDKQVIWRELFDTQMRQHVERGGSVEQVSRASQMFEAGLTFRPVPGVAPTVTTYVDDDGRFVDALEESET